MRRISRKAASFISASLFPVLLLFGLSACAQMEKSRDIERIKEAVVRYNKEVINAAKTGDVRPLKSIATEEIVRKFFFWRAAWADSDYYMDAELKDLKFNNVNISAQQANVSTSEDWIYEYRNVNTGRIVSPHTRIFYEMEYILRKKSDKWTITEINIKSGKTIK